MLLLLTVALASALGVVLAADLSSAGESFPDGYLTVSIGFGHAEAVARLLDAGMGPILSPSNTHVLVSRINRLEQVPISEIDTLLDPLDPRRDPFIAELASYFEIDGRNVVYARHAGSLLRGYRQVRTALGPDVRVAELDALARLAGVLVTLAAAGTSLIAVRKSMGWRMLAWTPLFAPALLSGLAAGFTAAVTGLAIDWVVTSTDLVRKTRDGDGAAVRSHAPRFLWLVAVAALGGATLVVLQHTGALIVFLCAVVAAVSLHLLPSVARRHTLDEGHRRFHPVQILRRHRFFAAERRRRHVSLAVLVGIAVVVLGADLVLARVSSPRPVSQRPVADAVTLEDVQPLAGSTGLPNVADYLAHRAYQESFIYGGAYKVPAPGEEIVIERFNLAENGSLVAYEEPVLAFDQSWVDAALEESPDGLVSLLARSAPAGVALSRREPLYSRYSRIVLHLLFLLLSSLPFMIGPSARVRGIGSARNSGSPGRIRQVA